MRTITVPAGILKRWMTGDYQYAGRALEFAVHVDWPELKLTDEQVMANAFARAYGHPVPYPDHSIFSVALPIGEAQAKAWAERHATPPSF